MLICVVTSASWRSEESIESISSRRNHQKGASCPISPLLTFAFFRLPDPVMYVSPIYWLQQNYQTGAEKRETSIQSSQNGRGETTIRHRGRQSALRQRSITASYYVQLIQRYPKRRGHREKVYTARIKSDFSSASCTSALLAALQFQHCSVWRVKL